MTHSTRSRFRFGALLPIALIWLAVSGLLVVLFWPDLPSTWLQWLLFIAFGPPLYVLGEEFFGWVFSPRHGAAISKRTFSLRRIFAGVCLMLVCIPIVWGLVWLGSNIAA